MFSDWRISDYCKAAIVLTLLGGCSASSVQLSPSMQTVNADLATAHVRFDLYLPATNQPAPLVVIAHGWLRGRSQMAGWGNRLAEEGFIVAIPDLPAMSDHPFNARAMNELITWLCEKSSASSRIDRNRICVMGFSSGGLSTLLAAADNPAIRIWVGLDPVDRRGLGVAAAKRFGRKAVIVRAPPSSWNYQGNALTIRQSLPNGCVDYLVPDAIHIDPEWPTDWQMEMLIGKSSESRRQLFVEHALNALKTELMNGDGVVKSK